MKRSKWLTLTAMLLALALVAAACGGDDGGEDDDAGGNEPKDCTWTIGTMGALSGDYATLGLPISQGVEYAVNQANEAGDLACELEYVSEDSQGSPDQAPALAQNLVGIETLVACMCPYFSGETLATGDIFADAGVLISGTGTNDTIDEQGFETWFRGVASDGVQGPVAAQYIQAAYSPGVVAVVHDNQDYSKGLAESVQAELGDVAEGPFVINPEETDYSAVVSQIANANPDAIFYGGYYEEAGLLRKQLVENGVDVPFMSDDGALDPGFVESAGQDAAAGVIWSCPCADPTKVEGAENWVQEMKDEFGDEAPGTFAADMYDVTNIAIEALKELDGSEDIEEVRAHIVEYMQNLEGYEGIVKSYSWDDTGEFEGGPEDVWIYEHKGGDITSVGPAQELIEGA
jgi:branched-chain amino acid transport system substrate-binding protein